MKFDAEELNLIELAQNYADEGKARELLESLLWPNGPVCPHCKCDDGVYNSRCLVIISFNSAMCASKNANWPSRILT